MTAMILRGDARNLPLPDHSVDAICTDPPYGLEFMGQEWDSFKPSSAQIRTRVDGRSNPAEGKSTTRTPEAYVAGRQPGRKRRYPQPRPFQEWCEQWGREALRVLKPGGYLLAFGGTRTSHRLTCGIEDAGFEIRDAIAWIYGQGFPKSLDVSKAIDAAAGAEREVVGLSPYSHDRTASSYQVDDGQHGYVGRSEGTRLVTAAATDDARTWAGWGTALVLDPFAGSGTTLEAALYEGFNAIGIEQDPAYLPLIRLRIARAGRRGQRPRVPRPRSGTGRSGQPTLF